MATKPRTKEERVTMGRAVLCHPNPTSLFPLTKAQHNTQHREGHRARKEKGDDQKKLEKKKKAQKQGEASSAPFSPLPIHTGFTRPPSCFF